MATISVAFVAVESVNSYTVIACERILGLYDFVKSTFNNCRSKLVDEQTLELLKPINLNGQNTNTVIEKTKRTRESINKKIDDSEKNMKDEVKETCKARSMSSLCFFIFLSNTLLLFMGGLEGFCPNCIHVFVIFFCVFFVIYLLLGWFFGETENPKCFLNFSSLWHPTLSCIAIVLISFILCFLFKDKDCFIIDVVLCWHYALIAIILSSYLNFVVFVVVMRRKAKTLKNKAKTETEELEKECEKLHTQVDDLMGTERIEAVLAEDN